MTSNEINHYEFYLKFAVNDGVDRRIQLDEL